MNARGSGDTAASLGPRGEKFIIDLTGGTLVCDSVEIADRLPERMRGLLGRQSLRSGKGLLLQPAPSIHTAFMRFPIDAVFVDGALRVVKIVAELKPWRVAWARRAQGVLEVAAREASRREIKVGDQLAVVEPCNALLAGARHADGGGRPRHATGGPTNGVSGPTERGADPLRVLVVAPDRRFRAVAGTLLSQRGYAVALGEDADAILRHAQREHVHVVVLDADHSLTAAARVAWQLEALDPPVGTVVVAEEPEARLAGIPFVLKWESFDRLCAAIEDARAHGRGPSRI